jgi:hypothetical protein
MIEKLFAIIRDGKWHQIDELSDKTKLEKDKLTRFFQFLSTQNIVAYQEITNSIKVKPEWQNLLPTETEPPATPKRNPAK